MLSPFFTGVVCSRNGRKRSFSSPQSRNAPFFPVSMTSSIASPPRVSFGSLVVAISRSRESLYKNTSTGSPGSSPLGTCFFGRRTCSDSVPRYTPKSTSFSIINTCFSPNFITFVLLYSLAQSPHMVSHPYHTTLPLPRRLLSCT